MKQEKETCPEGSEGASGNFRRPFGAIDSKGDPHPGALAPGYHPKPLRGNPLGCKPLKACGSNASQHKGSRTASRSSRIDPCPSERGWVQWIEVAVCRQEAGLCGDGGRGDPH